MERLQVIFREVFDDENIILKRETTSADIDDWDSLAQINLIVAIEDEFKIKFNIEEISMLQNVGEMLDLIERKLS